jgi:hypothetical protein
VWAWALSLLGYEFYLAKDAALRVQFFDNDDGDDDDKDDDSRRLSLRECGCAPGISQREVALSLEALEKWVLRTRNLWEELRWRAAGLRRQEGQGP